MDTRPAPGQGRPYFCKSFYFGAGISSWSNLDEIEVCSGMTPVEKRALKKAENKDVLKRYGIFMHQLVIEFNI